MTRIVAYTYEAAYHCPDCTRQRFAAVPLFAYGNPDKNGVEFTAKDNEGNPVHPVFDTDQLPSDLTDAEGGCHSVNCGDCHALIAERDASLEGGNRP